MASLSPLMSNFGALLEGLMTVRAFAAQTQFQDKVIKVVDTFQAMGLYFTVPYSNITFTNTNHITCIGRTRAGCHTDLRSSRQRQLLLSQSLQSTLASRLA